MSNRNPMIKSDLYGALARGYCSEKNSSKIVDPDLIEAMADEILLLCCQKKGDFMGTENKIQECKCEDKSTNYHLTVCCKGMKNEDGTLNKKELIMDRKERINRMEEHLKKQIDYIRSEYSVTLCEMLGILENAKLNIFYEQQQIGDEDVE